MCHRPLPAALGLFRAVHSSSHACTGLRLRRAVT